MDNYSYTVKAWTFVYLDWRTSLLYLKRKFSSIGTSPVVQWLGLHAFTAEGTGSIPGWGIKVSQAMGRGQKKKVFPLQTSNFVKQTLNSEKKGHLSFLQEQLKQP